MRKPMTNPAASSPLPQPRDVLAGLLATAGLPPEVAGRARLTGVDPVLPSSFAMGTAAQTSIAAAALSACELGVQRGQAPQAVSVDMRDAALDCAAWYRLQGVLADRWDPFSGLYRASDDWVRIHANFRHHREGAMRVLGVDPATAQRADLDKALSRWRAIDFESAAVEADLVVTALRSFDNWDATPHGQAIAAQPLFTIERIGDADPLPLPPLGAADRPLKGLRVVELTRILAGPTGGRTLAAHGADVLLVNGPHLPNIGSIADTSRGKRSAHVDLRTDDGKAALRALVQGTHVFLQGYRPGGLAAKGFGPQEAAALRPGVVYVSLTAYGAQGPWARRRGYDSLVQSAMGFNKAEGEAAGAAKPQAFPLQMLDEATGYFIALATAAAVRRQQREGGSWHVQLSLAQTAQWLRGLGRVADGFGPGVRMWRDEDMAPHAEVTDSGWGPLEALRHAAILERTPAGWDQPSMPPGSHPPVWW